MFLAALFFCGLQCPMCRVPTHPGKPWNLKKGIFHVWKVRENDLIIEKMWNSTN